jgi:hypothetical protein
VYLQSSSSGTLPPQPAWTAEGEELYEVRAIVGHRTSDTGTEFHVMWAGYPDSEGTWEWPSMFQDGNVILASYLEGLTQSQRRAMRLE